MTPPPAIRVLAVDDHALLRQGIAALLATEPDLVLAGEAATGREAIEQYEKLRPDVTLMDLRMPDLDGIEALSAIRQKFPHARVIILTTYKGDVQASRALKAGARAYLLKSLLRTELIDTIRAVQAGERRIGREIDTQLLDYFDADALSDREIDVLRLIADGNSNRSIATQLNISEGTVKGRIKSLLAKLGARDRTQAVIIAVRRGIITL